MAKKTIDRTSTPFLLEGAAKTYRERNKTYGNSYKRHGEVMRSLFPEGILLKTTEDFNRFGVLNMIVSKLCRYAAKPEGHLDSIHDTVVYSAMLEELDLTVTQLATPLPSAKR